MSALDARAEHLAKLIPADLPPSGRRERLRFTDFQFARGADGRCSAEVELEWVEGVRVRGTSAGQSSQQVDLRVAAEAASTRT